MTDGLDENFIWILWACPGCQHVNKVMVSDVGFGFEIDLQQKANGSVDAWFEADCQMCDMHFEKHLTSNTS